MQEGSIEMSMAGIQPSWDEKEPLEDSRVAVAAICSFAAQRKVKSERQRHYRARNSAMTHGKRNQEAADTEKQKQIIRKENLERSHAWHGMEWHCLGCVILTFRTGDERQGFGDDDGRNPGLGPRRR